jgi:hypothetical protein
MPDELEHLKICKVSRGTLPTFERYMYRI